MNSKALQTLEYTKIIDLLASHAASQMGKDRANNLIPMTNIKDIKRAQRETTEATTLILRKGSLPLGGIRDIRSALQRALVGGMLGIEELLHIGDFLYVCGKIQSYGYPDERYEALEMLQSLFDGVLSSDHLESEIKRCVLNQQELSDAASPALANVRRSIRTSNDRIRDHLNGVIQSAAYRNMLQDPIITIRNDRYCVPVKAEYRGSFNGMIHDQSASGATLFIEPASVVQLNNKIKELFFEERKEIERILMQLSGLVAGQADVLSASIDMLTRLDFIFAKGELSLAMRATEPIFNEQGYINIRKGRHPLLPSDKVVPTDIYIGKDFTTLLITGPNTGGKTVSLKTVGLFTLMGQAGMHIPAFDNSELAVFNDVFADIGDEQSIEQSLSTFSSHMRNIVSILEAVKDNALVLLDELGAGTDPTEGAALGISILQYLHDRQIRAVVTTHYSELKVYAISTPGVENASCEFDVETLRPTYRLLIGIPGKSNAFAISRRLGLPEHIIDHARGLLSQEDVRFEDMITDLEISKKTVMLEKDRAEQYRREAENTRKQLETQQEKLKNQRERILNEARAEAVKLVRDAKDQADDLYKGLQKHLRGVANQKEIEEQRQAMRSHLSGLEKDLADATGEKRVLRPLPEKLQKGDKVFVHTLNQKATVVNEPDNSGEVMVQAGIMKVKVKLQDLSLDETKEKPTFNQSRATSSKVGKAKHISPEVDLRGMLVQEGIEKTRKYLDDACLANLPLVTIIHGKGTGALRKAVHEYLKKHPHVKDYRLGTFGEGEDGVTIVNL